MSQRKTSKWYITVYKGARLFMICVCYLTEFCDFSTSQTLSIAPTQTDWRYYENIQEGLIDFSLSVYKGRKDVLVHCPEGKALKVFHFLKGDSTKGSVTTITQISEFDDPAEGQPFIEQRPFKNVRVMAEIDENDALKITCKEINDTLKAIRRNFCGDKLHPLFGSNR